MAVGPAVSASVADLRNVNQTQQEPVTRPVAEGDEGEQQIGANGASVDATPSEPTVVNVTDTSADRGENQNPGAAALGNDDRLPGSGDPNRGTTLDIAV
ncbi:hypothetical protein [Nisaea denitrificans]|uniref:hypothetical protein n=1 Tax=Nisaea denitrificans TaxID=390877 RepID=UPI00048FDA0A|nr:hypothetical protein [Nisaea denitrificans]